MIMNQEIVHQNTTPKHMIMNQEIVHQNTTPKHMIMNQEIVHQNTTPKHMIMNQEIVHQNTTPKLPSYDVIQWVSQLSPLPICNPVRQKFILPVGHC